MPKEIKNILLACAGPVSEQNLRHPVLYGDILGRPYCAIHPAEPALLHALRLLGAEKIDRVFLLASEAAQKEKIPAPTEFGAVTPLAFLTKRLNRKAMGFGEKLEILPLREGKTEQPLAQATAIAGRLLAYAALSPDAVSRLYVCLAENETLPFAQGLLELLRLGGIELGGVFRADTSKKQVLSLDQREDYRPLFEAVGAFSAFCQSDALQDYFAGKEISPALRALLAALGEVAASLHLCRAARLEADLDRLAASLDNFPQASGPSAEEQLFVSLLRPLASGLSPILAKKRTRPAIIRWCVQKNFLWLALLLALEWLPRDLVSQGILRVPSEKTVAHCQQKAKERQEPWEKMLVLGYGLAQTLSVPLAQGLSAKAINEAFGATLQAGKAEDLGAWETVGRRLKRLFASGQLQATGPLPVTLRWLRQYTELTEAKQALVQSPGTAGENTLSPAQLAQNITALLATLSELTAPR